MSECTHDCSTCGVDCASRQQNPESLLQPCNELSHIRKVIAVVSGKGGVGKSLVTSLLSVNMKREGYEVGIMDADITGPSIPRMFGLTAKCEGSEQGIYPVRSKLDMDVISINCLLENDTDPVVWRGPVIAGTVTQFWTDVIWGDKDFLFIDMPPGTGDVPLTVFQSIPIDGIIVVASPQELVGMIVEKAVKMADLMKIPVLGLVENMSYFECPDCGKKHFIYGDSKVEEIAKKYDIQNIARIPINPKLSAAADKGMIELYEGDWLDDLTAALKEI